jgi:hypothetical protein
MLALAPYALDSSVEELINGVDSDLATTALQTPVTVGAIHR